MFIRVHSKKSVYVFMCFLCLDINFQGQNFVAQIKADNSDTTFFGIEI